MTEQERLTDFIDALLSIDRIKATEIATQVYGDNADLAYVEKVVVEALKIIGEGWETGHSSLAQVYMSGVICEELIDSFIQRSDVERKAFPKLGIGVLKDSHALGKRIVSSVIKSGGYEVTDLGHGLSVDELVRRTLEQNIEVLLISTLMLPSALKAEQVKEKLAASGKNIKIIVGGAPFRLDTELWRKVGADADGKNATDILSVLEGLVKETHE